MGGISETTKIRQNQSREKALPVPFPGLNRMPFDLLVFAGMVFIINFPLLAGQFNASFVFFPSSVTAGEWWRVITYPFVHVSWYHLLLDAGAFFLLYTGLKEKHTPVKLIYVVTCGITPLVCALIFSPMLNMIGLCGLSGIAHGLMAVTGLEMILDGKSTRTAHVTFWVVVVKSGIEAVTGKVFFAFMHLGLCGQPVALCHAGGVIGGLMVFWIIYRIRKDKQ